VESRVYGLEVFSHTTIRDKFMWDQRTTLRSDANRGAWVPKPCIRLTQEQFMSPRQHSSWE